MNVYIYTLTCPITNKIMYIGKTINLKERLSGHFKEKKNNKNKIEWIKNLRIKGLKPIIEILDEVDESNWQIFEKYWIYQFKNWGFNLLNICEGGEGIKIRGFKHNKETKNKISISGKGRKHSDETRKLMSLGRIGIKFSDSHIENLSKSHIGKVNTSCLKQVIQIDCITGEKIKEFNSIRSAELNTGVYNELISKCCKGKCKRAGGYYWCYKSDFEKFKFKPFIKTIPIVKSSKAIIQINPINNEMIKEFNSIREASIFLGKKCNGRSNIIKSIYNDGLAYGYKWDFKKIIQ